jgi:hypothetical protein
VNLGKIECGVDSNGTRQWRIVRFCEHSNESPGHKGAVNFITISATVTFSRKTMYHGVI